MYINNFFLLRKCVNALLICIMYIDEGNVTVSDLLKAVSGLRQIKGLGYFA